MNRLQGGLLFAGALFLAGCNVDASGVASTASPSEAIVGSFEVKYSVSTGSGVSSFQLRHVTELRFGPDFVVLRQADGGGLALPVARVHEINWESE